MFVGVMISWCRTSKSLVTDQSLCHSNNSRKHCPAESGIVATTETLYRETGSCAPADGAVGSQIADLIGDDNESV